MELYRFVYPENFTVGAIGNPGERLFFIQIKDKQKILTLKVEKQQVSAISYGLRKVFKKEEYDEALEGALIDEPLDINARVESIDIDINTEVGEVILKFYSIDSDGAEVSIEVILVKHQALLFAQAGEKLVNQGRPTCIFCAHPIGPGEHVCPRQNGHFKQDQ